jgi:hypothetical protein
MRLPPATVIIQTRAGLFFLSSDGRETKIGARHDSAFYAEALMLAFDCRTTRRKGEKG